MQQIAQKSSFKRLPLKGVFLLLFTLLLVEIIYPGIDVFADPTRDMLRTLDTMRRRWDTQAITHYRIALNIRDCISNVEVRDEKIVHISDGSCQFGATVSSLFQKIDEDTKRLKWVNGNCDILAVHPTFDSQWGYPLKIEYQVERATPANIGGLAYMVSHPFGPLDPGMCTLLWVGEGPIIVKSLTPLP